MSYLLDTNVLSEFVNSKPNAGLVSWIQQIPNDLQYISVLTIGEIRKGIESMDNSKRQHKLRHWLELDLPAWYEERILPIDVNVADRWGRILADSGRQPLPAIDALLAATALTYDLIVVTRNQKDFPIPGLKVINPWS